MLGYQSTATRFTVVQNLYTARFFQQSIIRSIPTFAVTLLYVNRITALKSFALFNDLPIVFIVFIYHSLYLAGTACRVHRSAGRTPRQKAFLFYKRLIDMSLKLCTTA